MLLTAVIIFMSLFVQDAHGFDDIVKDIDIYVDITHVHAT